MVAAAVLHLGLVAGRSILLERLAVSTPFEGRIFLALLLAFVALVGCRRLGESPVAGTLASGGAAALILAAIVGGTPETGPLPFLSGLPWWQAARVFHLTGYALAAVGLAVFLSLRLRPPKTDRVCVRGLVASGDVLTDHPYKATVLLQASVPFLVLALALRLHGALLLRGCGVPWTLDLVLHLTAIVGCSLLLHLARIPRDPAVAAAERAVTAGILRPFLTRRAAAPLLGLAAILGGLAVASARTGSDHTQELASGACLLALATLLPCVMRRTRLRLVDPLPPTSFDLLLSPPDGPPPTQLEVQNPQLGRADLDDALAILGLRPAPSLDPPPDGAVMAFGRPTEGLGLLAHLVLVPLLLLLVPCLRSDPGEAQRASENETMAIVTRPDAAPVSVTIRQILPTFTRATPLVWPSSPVDRLAAALPGSALAVDVRAAAAPRALLARVRVQGQPSDVILTPGSPLPLDDGLLLVESVTWHLTLAVDRGGAPRTARVTLDAPPPPGFLPEGWRLSPTVLAGLLFRRDGTLESLDPPTAFLVGPGDRTLTLLQGSPVTVPGALVTLKLARPQVTLRYSRDPYAPFVIGLLGLLGLLLILRSALPWYLVAYHIQSRRETSTVQVQVYAGGLSASPSRLIKLLTGGLVTEHESML